MAQNKPVKPDNRRELLRYAGLSTEVVASVGLSIFIGVKADKWLHVSFPLLTWALPLLVIVVLIVKLIKESSKNRDGK
ncbi:AtpZ/AtpI family protein [Flavitalea flava]